MVGVPALEKCDCGPSLRIGWPPLSWPAADHRRAPPQRQEQRGQRGQDAAEGQVAEQAEEASPALQPARQFKQHRWSPPGPCASSALTILSIALPREPFTSTQHMPGGAGHVHRRAQRRSARSAWASAWLSKWRRRRRRHDRRRAERAQRVQPGDAGRRAHGAPASACSASASGPSSRMSPSTSQASSPLAASVSIAALQRAGVGVVAVVDHQFAPLAVRCATWRPGDRLRASLPGRRRCPASGTPQASADRRGQRVAHVVAAGQRQLHLGLALRRDQHEAATLGVVRGGCRGR
jgi:hypothetical protein